MTHYDTLGVAQDASADEIKQAFRRAASAAHPDKGGGTERMQAVNKAYEVLNDEARRAAYDATGQDDGARGIDEEARSMLVDLFHLAMESDGDWLQAVRQALGHQRQHLDQNQTAAHARRARLQRHSGKIKAKTGENLVQQLVDNQIQQIDLQLQAMERGVLVNTAAHTLLDNYEREPDAATYSPVMYGCNQPGAQSYNAGVNAGVWNSLFGGR